MQITSADGDQPQVILVKGHVEETAQYLVGIGKTFLNIIAGVAAMELVQSHTQKEIAGRNRLRLIVELHRCIYAACASHEYLTLLLRIQVHKQLAAHEARLELGGAGQTGLLRYGEKALQRSVLDLAAVHHCQSHGYTHAVIGPEGGTAGLEPAVLHVGLDGLGQEIMFQCGVFLAHHVLMGLHDNRLTVLESGSGRFGYQHVTYRILAESKAP